MAGSLWQQKLDSAVAEQLTAGSGYDYQPDCSPDGRWVVYASYSNDAVELWALNVETKRTQQLTSGGAVNLEPRFSPDGKRIAFVSTSFNGRFHIFVGQFSDGELKDVQRLTGENRSTLPRYYYSQYDHEISPAWSPDGQEILFVSNRGHIYGTGGFWRMKAETGRRGARDSLRRNCLESAAGFFTRRQAHRLRFLSGTAVAPALGAAPRGRRCVPAFLRRFRQRSAPLVAGWKADRIHFESQREYFFVDADRSRRRSDSSSLQKRSTT